jgi:Bifunctional DNA primase/polymerase, N-terminal
MTADLARAAIAYARRGLPVLPLWWTDDLSGQCACGGAPGECKPGKHPLGDLVHHGVKDATLDQRTIAEWWRRYPPANIGIACGREFRLLVVDIDPDAGGADSWAALEREEGAVPPKGAHGNNFKPQFNIKRLVDRPADLSGSASAGSGNAPTFVSNDTSVTDPIGEAEGLDDDAREGPGEGREKAQYGPNCVRSNDPTSTDSNWQHIGDVLDRIFAQLACNCLAHYGNGAESKRGPD